MENYDYDIGWNIITMLLARCSDQTVESKKKKWEKTRVRFGHVLPMEPQATAV